jgi:hypothetical protein
VAESVALAAVTGGKSWHLHRLKKLTTSSLLASPAAQNIDTLIQELRVPSLDHDLFAPLDDELLPETLRDLIRNAPLPSLSSGPRDEALTQALTNRAVEFQRLPPACLAGLWLLAGDLDKSHTISQSIGNRNGSFWHGIMHRREGDYSNAKYWLRRAAPHRVLDLLAESRYGDPLRFVEACERAVTSNADEQTAMVESLRQLQWLEWQQLFVHCLNEAAP